MTEEKLEELIGTARSERVHEMGGVMSVLVSSAANSVALGILTPKEGLEVFEWALKKEKEIKAATKPQDWEVIKRDGMSVKERGEEWFKELANANAEGIGTNRPY